MTGNFANQFKESDDVELVSQDSIQLEAGAATSHPVEAAEVNAESVEANAKVPPASDGSTPWKKRKTNTSYRRRFWITALVTLLIICGTLYSAVLAIPNGPALVLSQIGIVIGNRWMILKAYEIGYHNSPYDVSNLVTWANERAAYNKLDAIQLYNDCLALDPKYPYSYLNRGVTYYYLKDYEKAMADYNKAIELNPRYALALDNRASLWMDSGELEAALSDETRAIVARQESHTYHFNRARIYRKLKRYDEALKDFKRAEELGEDYQRVQHEIEATMQLQNK